MMERAYGISARSRHPSEGADGGLEASGDVERVEAGKSYMKGAAVHEGGDDGRTEDRRREEGV